MYQRGWYHHFNMRKVFMYLTHLYQVRSSHEENVVPKAYPYADVLQREQSNCTVSRKTQKDSKE